MTYCFLKVSVCVQTDVEAGFHDPFPLLSHLNTLQLDSGNDFTSYLSWNKTMLPKALIQGPGDVNTSPPTTKTSYTGVIFGQ